MDKVDRFLGSLSWLQPILRGKNPEKSRDSGYSKVNKMEENPSFAKEGVEKKKRFLEVIYKKESLYKHLPKVSGWESWHEICLYFYMVIMA